MYATGKHFEISATFLCATHTHTHAQRFASSFNLHTRCVLVALCEDNVVFAFPFCCCNNTHIFYKYVCCFYCDCHAVALLGFEILKF